jgi:flagellin-like hook-associated protein FlgL
VTINPLGNSLITSQILRNLNVSERNINTSLERLSSGLRINRAADDPIGIAQASRFTTQIRGTDQVNNNIQNALSLSGTAASSAQGLLSNLQRLRELTLLSLSDSTSDSDRSRIQAEFSQLVQDTDRLARGAKFAGRSLLDGSSEGIRLFRPAQASIAYNFTYDSTTTGNLFAFLDSNIQIDGQVDRDDTFIFRQQLDTNTNKYSLEIRSARAGVVAFFPDLDNSPGSFSLSVPGPSGSGPLTLNVNRAPFDFERLTGPLTVEELNKPLEQLVNNDRLSPITYGNLAVNLGGNAFNINVTEGMTLQGFLNALNGLSSGANVVNAAYDSGTGRINLAYTGRRSADNTTVTPYAIPDPAAAGGPYATFAAMPTPAQGPAYRNIALPATGFAVTSPPANFPALPSALNTSFNFSGSSASVLSVFGLANTGNLGTVSSYDAQFYGETIATSTPSEYVNRTRAVISSVTAQQTVNGTNTGLTAADTTKTFRVLNTGKVTAAALSAGSFNIDFGANGVFSYTVNPNTTTMGDIVTAINNFAPGQVSANFDSSSDQLTITNTPPLVSRAKVDDPGLTAGLVEIDLGDNGLFSYNFDPNVDTISTFVTALNSFGGGNVTAAYDAASDRLSLSNNALTDNQINFVGAPADALRQFFKLNNAISTGGGVQTQVSATDIDNSSISSTLDVTSGDVTGQTFANLTSPIALPQDNRIVFGGANGTAIAAFFKLSNLANNGSGSAQTSTSSSSISNSSLDASLDITAADVTSTSLQALRTPRLNTLVSGALTINGQTAININANTTTLANVLDAINGLAGASNRTYNANFSTGVAGGLQIRVSDTESLANAGTQPVANPSAGSPTLTANQLTLDSSAYFANGAPVFQQPTFNATPLPSPYVTSAPGAPANISGISFGGASNLASILFLPGAASGTPSVVGDEYMGTSTATSHNTYNLTGVQRRTFQASSSVTSTQRLGFDTSAIDEAVIPADGIVAEIHVKARVAPKGSDDSLSFQVTPESGGSLRLSLGDLTADRLRLEDISLYREGESGLQTRLRGNTTLRILERALEDVLNVLGQAGSTQNILDSRLSLNTVQRDNAIQARSRIQDADAATEISRLTQAQITAQAGAFALSRNNISRAGVVDILFGSLLS